MKEPSTVSSLVLYEFIYICFGLRSKIWSAAGESDSLFVGSFFGLPVSTSVSGQAAATQSVYLSLPVSLHSRCPDNPALGFACSLLNRIEDSGDSFSVFLSLHNHSCCTGDNAFDMFCYSSDLEPVNPATRAEQRGWRDGGGGGFISD